MSGDTDSDKVNIVTTDAEYRYEQELGPGPEWGTPPHIVEPLAEALGGFDLDPASGAEPEPYADVRYTREDDGLVLPWFDDVWLNPPYGRFLNPVWAEKIRFEIERGEMNTLTVLTVASTSSDWFQETYKNADYLTFLNHRVKFLGQDECERCGAKFQRDAFEYCPACLGEFDDESYAGASFDSVVCSFGDFPGDYVAALPKLGKNDWPNMVVTPRWEIV